MKTHFEFERTTLELKGSLALLTLNDPQVLNAVSVEMLQGLTEALDTLGELTTRPRCLVLTGTGRAFSTGANLQGRGGKNFTPRSAGRTLETVFHPFLRRLREPALSDRDGGQWTGRRSRHKSRAYGRSRSVRARSVLSASVSPDWAGAGLRLHLAIAALDWTRTGNRTFASRRTFAGGDRAGMGIGQSRVRRRPTHTRSVAARRRPRGRPDGRARLHSSPLLGEPREFVRAAARP